MNVTGGNIQPSEIVKRPKHVFHQVCGDCLSECSVGNKETGLKKSELILQSGHRCNLSTVFVGSSLTSQAGCF